MVAIHPLATWGRSPWLREQNSKSSWRNMTGMTTRREKHSDFSDFCNPITTHPAQYWYYHPEGLGQGLHQHLYLMLLPHGYPWPLDLLPGDMHHCGLLESASRPEEPWLLEWRTLFRDGQDGELIEDHEIHCVFQTKCFVPPRTPSPLITSNEEMCVWSIHLSNHPFTHASMSVLHKAV